MASNAASSSRSHTTQTARTHLHIREDAETDYVMLLDRSESAYHSDSELYSGQRCFWPLSHLTLSSELVNSHACTVPFHTSLFTVIRIIHR